MKNPQLLIIMLSAVFVCGATQAALAQSTPCPCNCYFSSDCGGGQFCDWGNLSIEDSCFWRTPKPQGNPGVGCDEDYGNWGQCDGICSGTASANGFTPEDVPNLLTGISLWAHGMNDAALHGGGFVDDVYLDKLDDIAFLGPEMADDVGKIVVEVMMLSRGPEFLSFPPTNSFTTAELEVNALTAGSCADVNGVLATEVLKAEILEAGSGANIAAEFNNSCLEIAMLEGMCDSPDAGQCLYQTLTVLGEALGRAGRTQSREIAGFGGGGCWADGDCTFDGIVSIHDLITLLGDWGPCPDPADGDPLACPGDFDGDGNVGVLDLLTLLGAWS